MPFTANDFLDVFAAYNQAMWPFAAILWVLTAAVLGTWVLGVSLPAAVPRLLLAAHWLWAGLAYHAWFFTAINPAAWLFAALFAAQGVLFIACRSPARVVIAGAGSMRRVVSSVLIVYSLMYPALVWADGFVYPRMPTFGVPCPTVLLTIGFLVAAPASVVLSAIPVAWSLIAGTAVWLFGMHADLVLPAAGVVLVTDLFGRSHVMRKLSFATLFVLVAATLVLLPASSAFAQAAQHDHQQQAQKGEMKMGEGNTERINALMATVNSASGEAKVAAMADVMPSSSKSALRCRNTARR